MLGKKSGQMGFGDMEAMGRVPEGHFLQKIDSQINWRPFGKLMEPLYHPTQGRPSHPPLVMFKALLLQQWYGLSDPGLEEAICDRLSFQRFLGLSLQDPVPDETNRLDLAPPSNLKLGTTAGGRSAPLPGSAGRS